MLNIIRNIDENLFILKDMLESEKENYKAMKAMKDSGSVKVTEEEMVTEKILIDHMETVKKDMENARENLRISHNLKQMLKRQGGKK